MNFKKLFALTSLAVISLASTSAHADIKNKPGWHYVKVVNNLYNVPAINLKITNRDNGIHHKCYNIRQWQTIADRSFLVKSGDIIEYIAYRKKDCVTTFTTRNPNYNTIHSDKDEYWYVWF